MSERRRERYYRLAKKHNYRSRASFKLLQIDERFGVFREGDSVVDLGAFPGGWLQVAADLTGGKVVGVDLRPIKPMEGVDTIVGDITDPETMARLLGIFDGKVDVVLSDMAPNMGGNYATDHARSIHLCDHALAVCDHVLRKGGTLVMKFFMGDMADGLRGRTEKRFGRVHVTSPDASRPTSSEMYIIAKGFHADREPEVPEPEGGGGPRFSVKGDLA
ncbi:MAG: RlmE family RNA methyltransferase [Thermoplasmatales archaeon]|nr:RlmE family RNA methyltransferase [Thermoplasmatales archaeon]